MHSTLPCYCAVIQILARNYDDDDDNNNNNNNNNNNRAAVAQSVQCLTTDRTAGVRSPTKDFSPNLCVQTGSGAHPPSCTVGTGGKGRPGRDADHSPPSSAEVKKE
jgi:hypothetical protein